MKNMPDVKLTNGTLLIIVNFLHFVAGGLVLPILSKQITRYGGNHVVLGSLHSLIFIAQTVSKDFLEYFYWSYIDLVKYSLILTFLYFIVLVFAKMWWLICLIRIGYALTTQVLPYSKYYVKKTEQRNRKTIICNMIDIMRVVGLTVGNILGGFIFDKTRNVMYHSILGSFITLVAIFISSLIDDEKLQVFTSETRFFIYQQTAVGQLQNLRTVKFRNLWSRAVLKLMYLLTFVTFFSRYIFILCQNYKVNGTIVGWVRGYNYILRFVFSFISPFLIAKTSDKRMLFAHSMLISGVSLVALFYAPSYHCYLICFIPLMLSYTVVSSLLNEDILNFRSNMSVYQATETLGTIVNIVSPICYGISRQFTGAMMTKLLTLAPATIWAYLLHKNIFSHRILTRYSIYDRESLKQIFRASIDVEDFHADDDDENLDNEEVINKYKSEEKEKEDDDDDDYEEEEEQKALANKRAIIYESTSSSASSQKSSELSDIRPSVAFTLAPTYHQYETSDHEFQSSSESQNNDSRE